MGEIMPRLGNPKALGSTLPAPRYEIQLFDLQAAHGAGKQSGILWQGFAMNRPASLWYPYSANLPCRHQLGKDKAHTLIGTIPTRFRSYRKARIHSAAFDPQGESDSLN